jgi:hypothetical protein
MGKHTPTPTQVKIFKDAVKAIKKAKKAGLVIYAKQYDLVAYNKSADDYIESDFLNSLGTGFSQIECLSERCLADSGADDYGSYRSAEDEEKYS